MIDKEDIHDWQYQSHCYYDTVYDVVPISFWNIYCKGHREHSQRNFKNKINRNSKVDPRNSSVSVVSVVHTKILVNIQSIMLVLKHTNCWNKNNFLLKCIYYVLTIYCQCLTDHKQMSYALSMKPTQRRILLTGW